MSREIDERVVQMKFENGQFEKNIQTSIHSLDELKKGLDFKDAGRGFDNLEKASKSVKFDPITQAIQQLNGHFNLLGITAINVMNRISNMAIDTGERLVRSLTIDQITPGWEKYAQKTTSVQTIMAATSKQFSDTAKQMEVVNEQLDKLNWFTDETSYNFVDMVGNIGKFTSNNVDLETSVTAMQGIALWAAKSGANAGEASRAMYNLSQALATGAVKLIDWKSIENANMATTEFKQTAIDTAVELGTLTKVGDGLYKTMKGNEVAVSNFNEALSDAWFTSDVLLQSLDKYGAATNVMNEMANKYDATTSSLIKDVDSYIEAVTAATNETKKLALSEEESQKRVRETVSETAREIAESWVGSIEDMAEEQGKTIDEVTGDWENAVNEAVDYLQKFEDETMQFGLSALKAGQEAKTFAEAISSVTDAVSTGWMKSFEYLFGDYTEAKEFWTNIANTLYDIFAAGGDARNEMLADWKEQGGQKYFTDAIYATLGAILSILAPIKAAWQQVFGKVSATQLLNLTKRLRDFMLKLSASEETMQKIARVFRGLFSVLDLIKTVITELVGGALKGFQRIMAALGIDIGEFAASAGDVVYYLTQWIKQSGIVRTALNLLVDAIIVLIQKAKSFISQLSNWTPVQTAIEKFKDIAIVAFGLIGNAVYVLVDVFYWLYQQLQNFHLPTSFEEVKDFFIAFAEKVMESFEKIGISTDTLGDGFGVLGTIIKNTIGIIVNVFAAASTGVVATLDLINRYLSKVDWAGVLLAAFGVGTIAVMWKFTTALQGFATALQNVTGVGKAAKSAFTAIAGYFNEMKKNIQTNNLLKTAIAIAALAAACGILAHMDWKGVLTGGGAILAVALAVTILTNAFDKWSTKHGSMDGKGMEKMTVFVLSLAASMVLIAKAMNSVVIDDTLGQRMAVIGGALVVLAGVTAIFSMVAKPIEIGALSMVGIAASLVIMINALKSIKPEDQIAILSALPVVSALMLVLAGLSRLMTVTKKITTEAGTGKVTAKSGSSFMNVIGLVLGLHLMISAIKSLAKLRADEAVKGIILLIPLILGLKTLLKYANNVGKEAGSAGKMILAITVAVNLMYFAIKNMAKLFEMDATSVIGGLVVTGGIFATFFLLCKQIENQGKHAGQLGLMLIEMSASLAILQLVIKTLGTMDVKQALIGTASVAAIIVAFGFMLGQIEKGITADVNGLKALTNMTIMLGIISGLVLILTWLDPVGALGVCVGLAAMFGALGLAIKALNNIEKIDISATLKISAVVIAMGLIVGLLGKFTDWKGALAVAGGMSMILVALGAMMQLANKSTGGLTNAKLKPMALMVAELAAIMGGFTILLAMVGKDNFDPASIAVLTACMSGLMVAFGLMSGIMGSMKGKPDEKNINALLSIVNSFALVIGAFSAIAGIASMLGASLTDVIFLATGMSEIMIALGAMARLMNDVKIPNNISDLEQLAVIVGIITSIMAIIAGYASEHGADLSSVLTLSTAMGILLTSLGLSVRIMGKTDFKMGKSQALILGGLVAALGLVLAMFGNWVQNPSALIPMAIAMSGLLVGVAVAANILAMFPHGSMSAAIEGGSVVLLIIGVMAAILAALGALNEMLPGLDDMLDNGASMMISIGRGIGGFVGGIIGGIAEGVASGFPGAAESIASGMENLKPFFDGLVAMPENVLGLAQTCTDAIKKMTEPGFVTAIKSVASTKQAAEEAGDDLADIYRIFARAIKAFSDEVDGINAENVQVGVDAALKLAQLEAGLPKKGSIFATILGEDDLESFGARLATLGNAIWQFGIYGANIDKQGVEKAVSAAEDLQILEGKLPAKDGLLQAFFGQDGFDQFGERLRTLGSALVAFSDSVKGDALDLGAINNAVSATSSLSDLEANLPSTGGVFGTFFFGTSDLSKFGERLSTFGDAIAGFSSSVTGKVNKIGVQNAVDAAGLLADLEKDLDTSGGWNAFWNGDSTFKQFSTNLQSLGIALKSFSTNIAGINWSGITLAINFIDELVRIEKLDEAAKRTLSSAKNLMANILDVIKEQKVPIHDEAQDMAYWLAKGFADGMVDYEQVALAAAVNLANTIISTMNAIFKIHSPSVVMNEMGHWVVKGLGEGITEDMTAEEAAEQKAQDIITAFQNGLSKVSMRQDISNLEYELWTKTEGKGLQDNDPLLLQKQLDNEVDKLKSAAEQAGMLKTALAAVLETAGEESEAYQQAYKNYLESLSSMYDQQAVVDELQGANLTTQNQTWADQAKLFAQLQAENAEAFKFMGKSEEELRQWAAEQVGAGFARQMQVNDVLTEYADAFDRLGYSQEQRIAEAEKMLGPETAQQVENTLYDTNAIIEQALQETSYTLEEAVSKSLSSAVSKGGSSAAVGGAVEGLGESIPKDLTKAISEGVDGIDFDWKGLLHMDEMDELFSDPSSIVSNISGFFNGENGILGAITRETQPVTDAVKNWAGDMASSIFGEDKVQAWYDGAKSWLGEKGLGGGLKDPDAIDEVEENAKEAGDTAITAAENAITNGTEGTTASGNTRAYDAGESIPTEIALGTQDPVANALLTADSEKVAETTMKPIEKSVDEYPEIGENAVIGFANGMLSKRSVSDQAAYSIGASAKEQMKKALDEASPSKATHKIGMFASEGLALGILDNKPMVEDSASEVAYSAANALDYTKDLVNNILANDEDFNPTITPVLDLDTLISESKAIPNLLNRNAGLNISPITQRARAISSNSSLNRQNGSSGVTETNYNFTQNNYSPKALSRTEIYRQTNNQFSQLKGATKVR